MALKSRAGFTIETVISGASTTEFYKPINNTTTLFAVNSDVTAKLGLKADQTAVDALILTSATKVELVAVEAKIPTGAVLTNVVRETNGDLTLSFTDSATYPNKTVLSKTTEIKDTTPTAASKKAVESGGVKTELDKKQNISELVTIIRDLATSTDIKYTSEKSVRKELDTLLAIINGLPNQLSVNDITGRDTLVNIVNGSLVHVLDASADATVTSGWAKYQYLNNVWEKYISQEGLNVVSANNGDILAGIEDIQKTYTPKQVHNEVTAMVRNISYTYWSNTYNGYGDKSVTLGGIKYVHGSDGKMYSAQKDQVPVGIDPITDDGTNWKTEPSKSMRVTVPTKLALKALTATEYQRAIVFDTKDEYVFYKTANLTAEEIANVNLPNENIIDDANTGMWVLQTPKGVSVDFDYQLGHIIHAVPDSSKAIYEINGSTITDGKLAQYLNANQIDGFVINGNNITLPDWRGRYLGGAGGLGLAPAIGTTYASSNKTHRHIVGVNNASSGNSYGQSSINYSNTSNSPNSSVYTSNTGGVYARPETVAMPICIIGGRSIEIPKLLPTDVVVDKSGLVDGDVLVYDLAGDKFKKGVIPQPVIQPKEYFSFNFTGNGAGNIPSKTFTPTRTGEYRFTINSTGWLNSGTGMQGFLCNVSGTDNDNKSIEGRRFFHSSGKHDAIIWQKKKVKLIAGQQVTLSFTKTTSQIKVDSNDWITIDVVQL